jgi:D-alanyl-D-alanine carboxypeptidase
MTFLTALSYYHLDDILEIKTAFVEGSIVGFSLGQKVTFKNLLYGMMLPSGNDAALAIAQNYPGGEDAFIAQMNQNVKKWHLYNTHFADPAGLLDDATYTTVIDLARLSSIAMKNPVFAQIVGTKAITIETIDGKNIFSIKNLNQLLGLYGIDGIKTGYTEEAQGVLVTSVMNENHRSIIVVMRSQDRFTDTISLIQSIVNNLTYLSMSS